MVRKLIAILALTLLIIFVDWGEVSLPSLPGKRHYCTGDSPGEDVCEQQKDSLVCGYFEGGRQTFKNSCFACLNSSVEFWTEGGCYSS